MRRTFSILALILCTCCAWAATSLKLSLDRGKIYLGESVIASVSVQGSRSDVEHPVFTNLGDDELEYLGSRDNSRRSITIINGKRTEDSFEGRVFVYRIKPQKAGILDIGPITLKTNGRIVSIQGAKITVTGVEKRDDIFASIECADPTVLVDSPFTINVTVSILALPAPYSHIEPIVPQKPLHIEADFLNGTEVNGLKLPDFQTILNNMVSRRIEPSFTINQYASRGMSMGFFDFGGDPFAERPVNFRIAPKKVKHGDKDYWDYSISLDYTPSTEGDYTFGPLTVKGSFISGVDVDESACMEEVFVVGPAVTVRVVPPPEEGRPDWFIGSVGKSMKSTASFDTSYCKVGDPLTLTLDITGEISLSNLKPPLLSLQPGISEDFRIYDDNIESDNIEGGKRFKYRVRPLRAGTLEFPPVYTAYFNTTNGSYVTVTTPPMPLQAEATTQISTVAAVDDGSGVEDEAFAVDALCVPDGIMAASADPVPAFMRYGERIGMRKMIYIVIVIPLLWPLIILSKCIVARMRAIRSRGGLKVRARKSTRILDRASVLAKTDPAAAASMASGAARVAIAARLGVDTASITESEMRRELANHSVPQETADEICSSFSALERISYAHDETNVDEVRGAISRIGDAIAKMSTSLKILMAVALLSSAAAEKAFAGTAPDDFEWDRANQVMATASSQEDFMNAARMYYSMVTNGASSGPLYYNLATALLLVDGGKTAAMEALVAAEQHLGTTPEIATGMRLALSTESVRGQLPVSRVFLVWHYGLSYATRFDIAFFSFVALWLSLALIAVFGGKFRVLRNALRALVVLSLVLTLLYGGSVLVSSLQQRHVDMPHVANILKQDGGAL